MIGDANPLVRRPTWGRRRSLAASAMALGLLLAACGNSPARSVQSNATTASTAPSSTATAARGANLAPARSAPGEEARLAPLDLRARGFELVHRDARLGSRGNPVLLDRYASPTRRRPSPSGQGSDTVYVNAAYVAGLGEDVAVSTDNLFVPRGVREPAVTVKVGDRPGILVDDEDGRWVAFAYGDWRVQVSAGAPPEALSNRALLAIAAEVELT